MCLIEQTTVLTVVKNKIGVNYATSNSKPYLLPYGWRYRSYADSNNYIGEKVMRKKRGKPKVKVAQYSLDGKLLNVFDSLTSAAKHVYGYQGELSHCINGRITKAYGYKWKRI